MHEIVFKSEFYGHQNNKIEYLLSKIYAKNEKETGFYVHTGGSFKAI